MTDATELNKYSATDVTKSTEVIVNESSESPAAETDVTAPSEACVVVSRACKETAFHPGDRVKGWRCDRVQGIPCDRCDRAQRGP